MKARNIRWRQADLSRFAVELQRRYTELSNDREVLLALEELNKTANPKFALGPRTDYAANLAKMTEKLLKDEGFRRKNKGDIFTVAYVAALERRAMRSEEELKSALKLQDQQRILPKDKNFYKNLLKKAIQEGNEQRIADLQKEERGAEEKIAKIAQEVATRREAYVQNVAELRKAVDEAPQKIAEWKKNHPDIQIAPVPKSTRSYLAKAEKTITTYEVPLEPDKTVNWVEAILNGKGKPHKMVLDPRVDVVRMSASFAAASGIKLADDGITEEVAMSDGQKLPARRMTLESVKVGRFTAENVECLVILEGSEAPPLLGASFLDRYSYQLDPEAGKLTLTQVDFKPSAKKPGMPRNGL